MHGAVQLELVAIRLDRNVLEWGIGRSACVEVVADVSNIGVDNALLDLKDEGVRVVKRGIDLPAGTDHLPTNPADIDAEVGAFAKEQIVRVDQGGGEVISGGSVGCADGAESRERRGWRGSECLRPRIPEEPAEAEDGDCGSGGDKAGAGKGH